MGFFDKFRSDGQTYDGQGDERKGIIDNVFVNTEKNCLVHRYPYDNLSTHAKITVQEGQQMVFMSEGMYSDLFNPGGHVLSTNNLPFLDKIVNLPYGGDTAFKTTLYVVNTTRQRLAGDEGGWGTGLTIRDYTLAGTPQGVTIGVGAYGTYEFRITNAIAFIREYMGTTHDLFLDEFTQQFTSVVGQRVTVALSKYFSQQRVSVTEINNYLFDLSDFAKQSLNEYFEDYGVELTKFAVEGINPHEDDPNYQMVIQAQATAASRQIQGFTYQQERQLDVMETAAGNTGIAGGMMGAGMGLGMGFGMGGAMGSMMGGIAQNAMSAAPTPPPPTSQGVQIYLYLNNAQAGPYDMPILQQLVTQGVLRADTLAWKAGMPQWAVASTIPELMALFTPTPPPMGAPTPPVPPTI